MSESPDALITRTYDAILRSLGEALDLREALLLRDWVSQAARGFFWSRMRLYFRLFTPVLISFASRIPTSGTSPRMRERWGALATPSEREHRYFTEVLADYWLEQLSVRFCDDFSINSTRAAELKDIHGVRSRELTFDRLLGPTAWLSISAVALGIFATLIPQEAFAAIGFGSSYGTVRAVIAGYILLIGLTLLIAPVVTGGGRPLRREKRVRNHMDAVVAYCTIHAGHVPRA
jgi:hypothetical protein